MQTTKNNITLLFVLFVITFCSQHSSADVNAGCLVELGQESQKIVYLTESVYWPDFDFKNVKRYITEANSTQKSNFVWVVSQVIEPNYLPEGLAGKTCFLKEWRGDGSKNFVLQYEKPPYLIRIKNQTTTVMAGRKWTSYWFAIAIQLKDKGKCVNKTDPNNIFRFTDQFLSKKLNSEAQDYTNVTNMDGPVFKQIDEDYFLSYLVQASHPDIDSVSIWTDGYTVIINLKERRKEITN